MIHRGLFIFFAITFGVVCCYGQNNCHFGLTAGFSISKFPKKYTETDNSSYPDKYIYTRKEYPLLSPVIGLETEFTINKKICLLVGIEYQMTGTRYSGTNTSSSSPGINLFHENMTLHKICIPVTPGYKIKIKNNESLILCGLRPGILVNGRYYHKWENNIGPGYVSVTSYNPFKPQLDYIAPLKRFVVQFSIVISDNISEHLKANLCMNFGKSIYSYYHEFRNNDFSLSVTYLFHYVSKQNFKF